MIQQFYLVEPNHRSRVYHLKFLNVFCELKCRIYVLSINRKEFHISIIVMSVCRMIKIVWRLTFEKISPQNGIIL